MIPELGHFALILALLLSITQATFGLGGAARRNEAWMAAGRSAVAGQFVFVALAFGALAWSFIERDFSVLYVASNSHSQLPLFYRIAAVWGAHELVAPLVAVPRRLDARSDGGERLARDAFSKPRDWHPRAHQRRLPALHADDLEPVHTPDTGCDRGPRPQPAAAGFRAHGSSSDPVPGLRRVFGRFRFCLCGPARGPA
jgi:hypothetical protein